MKMDRFGNPHAPSLAYARGRTLATTEDDFRTLTLVRPGDVVGGASASYSHRPSTGC